MKKLILLFTALVFLAVSCSGSKKAENDIDTDILPYEDAADADGIDEDSDLDEEATDDDENNDELNDTDEDETEDIDPCEPNPCEGIKNSTGECTKANNSFICSCEEGHYWHGSRKGCLNDRPAYANVCTGQTKCYDNEKEIPCPQAGKEFYGQDAQYAKLGYCVPQSFSIDGTVPGEPVVVDNNTGNMWLQKIPPVASLNFEEVKAYCQNLVYGSYDDWELPLTKDFMTIADYGKYSPAIDTGYFPDYGAFWTAESYIADSTQIGGFYSEDRYAIIFDFKKPSTDSVLSSSTSWSGSAPYSFNISCIRRNTPTTPLYYTYSETLGRDIRWNNYNDLIIVRKRDLNHTWSEALRYCEELDYAGISYWRLPNIKELYLASEGGIHTSTTALANLNFDDLYNKYEARQYTECVVNDPCEKGKIWNGESCMNNPCSENPCKSEYFSQCIVVDEELYYCECLEGWDSELKQCIKNETPDADTDEIPDSGEI